MKKGEPGSTRAFTVILVCDVYLGYGLSFVSFCSNRAQTNSRKSSLLPACFLFSWARSLQLKMDGGWSPAPRASWPRPKSHLRDLIGQDPRPSTDTSGLDPSPPTYSYYLFSWVLCFSTTTLCFLNMTLFFLNNLIYSSVCMSFKYWMKLNYVMI